MRLFLTLASCFLLLGSAARAADYHVDPNGDDALDGLTPATAWRTLARAERQLLLPGDAILLRAGATWHESLWLGHSGMGLFPIEIAAYGPAEDGPPTISAADPDGTPVRKHCIELNQSHVRVRGVRFAGAAADGLAAVVIYAPRELRDIAIIGCTVESNAGRGIFVSGDPGTNILGLRIMGNVIRDNGGSGILMSHGAGVWIWDNRITGNCRIVQEPWQAGIRIWNQRMRDVRIERNLVAGQLWGHGDTAAMGIHVDETGDRVRVAQNEVRDVDHAAIEVENTRGVVVQFNVVRNAEAGIFVYRAGHDHLIRRNDIQARGHGIALQGFRAGGVNAGPEIELDGRLFSGNRIERNRAVASQWGSLKCVGGAESGVHLTGNDFGRPRRGMFEWGDAMFDDEASWRRAAGSAAED